MEDAMDAEALRASACPVRVVVEMATKNPAAPHPASSPAASRPAPRPRSPHERQIASRSQFIGEDEVGEDRAFARLKAAGLRVVNLRADDVGGHMSGVNCRRQNFTHACVRQRFHRERLGEAGHAFEEDVAVGQQADDQPLGQIILPDDDLAESLNSGCVNALASFTASLIALIPVLIFLIHFFMDDFLTKNLSCVQP